MSTDRISKTAWLYLSIAYLTVLVAFVKANWLAPIMSVLVAVLTLRWSDVAPSGAALAVALIMTGWLYDRYAIHQGTSPVHGPSTSELSRLDSSRAILFLSLLIASVMVIIEFVAVSIPVALELVGPPFAIVWYILIDFRPNTATRRVRDLTGKVTARLPSLHNEALVFAAANILGLGVASVVPTADLGSASIRTVPWADPRIFLLFATFVGCGFVGLHPVIVVLFIGSVLPPESLGLRDWIVGVIYLGCWGLCTMIFPFSGTTLFLARQTGTPAHVIAWQWASRPAILQAFALFLVTITIRHATL